MLDFRAWLIEAELETGVVYSNPVNDDRYAEKGIRSKREGGKQPAMPGPVDPDAMYLGTEDAEGKKQRLRGKKRSGLSK